MKSAHPGSPRGAGVRGARQPDHAHHQVRFRGSQHRMRVAGHQTIRMRLAIGFLASFSQRLDEVLPVNVIQKSPFLPLTQAHDVIQRPGISSAQLARHGGPVPSRSANRQSREMTKLWVTPAMSRDWGETY
jgi:hypothetical protein